MAENITEVLRDVENTVKIQTEGKVGVSISTHNLIRFCKIIASQSYLVGSGKKVHVDGLLGPQTESLLENVEGGPSIISELGL